jgi:hypothetical protein
MQPIALAPRGVSIPMSELSKIAGAISQQLARDVAPHWHVSGIVMPFEHASDAPGEYWQILVVPDAHGVGGMHSRPERSDEPVIAIVQHQAKGMWSLAASHEAIEMLIDPLGANFRTGPDPRGSGKTVKFLVEVCDPCQSLGCAYALNGVWVSDFVLPSFYQNGGTSGPFTLKENVWSPLSVTSGGILSWQETDTGSWHQLSPTGFKGPIPESEVMQALQGANLRGAVDRRNGDYAGHLVADKELREQKARIAAVEKSAQQRAKRRNAALEKFCAQHGLQG